MFVKADGQSRLSLILVLDGLVAGLSCRMVAKLGHSRAVRSSVLLPRARHGIVDRVTIISKLQRRRPSRI